MSMQSRRADSFDFVGAFEQAWVQYKANFFKLLFFGVLAALPPLLVFYNIYYGIAITFIFEGFFLLLLSDAVSTFNNSSNINYIARFKQLGFHYFKNGFVIALFIFPPIALGLLAFVIPSIIAFSLFLFSFSMVVDRNKFAIDACMESFRFGYGYRVHVFLLSLIFYTVTAFIYILVNFYTDNNTLIFFIALALFLPYFFAIIHEFYEQLEKK